ncbi:MAG TPA: hypothetical protein VGC01_00755 [Mucilaginibacter sp.]
MEPIIDNTQLDCELQELYMESSHWISDINFVEDEIKFLKKVLNGYLIYADNLQLNEADNFIKVLDLQEKEALGIKTKIHDFLKFIEPLVTNTRDKIGIDLIEKFISLQTEMASLTEYVKLNKNLVFSFIEEAIKMGKYTDVSVL